jgi:hypothetical protein
MLDNAIQQRLEAPFRKNDLDWKVQRSGIKQDGEIWALIIPYIDARAAQRRLDEVFGMDGWEVKYREINLGNKQVRGDDGKLAVREIRGVIATLRFRIPGTDVWVIREDGAEPTQVEPVKGGISSAFKRVVVTIGIGRYLYDVEPMFANVIEKGPRTGRAKDARDQWVRFCWEPRMEDVMRVTSGASTPPVAQRSGAQQAAPAKAKAPAPAAPVPVPTPTAPPRATQHPEEGKPAECPNCRGAMFDNRHDKRNPKAPDYRCKSRSCDGAIWPEKAPAPVPVPDDDDGFPY